MIVDGCPPRLPLDVADIQPDLDRRRPGQSRLVTQRQEADRAELLSGVFEGRTTGTPIAHRGAQRRPTSRRLRPPPRRLPTRHADYTYDAKYGFRDHRGGGRSSARETIGRVAAGAIARKLLAVAAGIEVLAWVTQVHDIDADVDPPP